MTTDTLKTWWKAALVVCVMALVGSVRAQGTMSADCGVIPTQADSRELACESYKGLLASLSVERQQGGKVLVVRLHGGDGEAFSQGESRLLFEKVVGEAAGSFLQFGEEHNMLIDDVNADGIQELAVASLVPINGAEQNLTILSLNPDHRVFSGVLFFQDSTGAKEKPYLSAPFSSEIVIGRTISVNNSDGSWREYKYYPPDIYRLISNTQ